MYRREKREERGLALLFARASARDPPVRRATEARVLFSHSATGPPRTSDVPHESAGTHI